MEQQQTSTSRWQTFKLFRQKLAQYLMKLVSSFTSNRNWLKITKAKKSRKPHISGIYGLRVKRQVKNPCTVLKEDPFVIF